MSEVNAIYQGGVFKPLEPVNLRENERVRLSIHLTAELDPLAWLEEARAYRECMRAKYGTSSDVTEDIAADRARDD